MRILVVDDDLVSRKTMRFHLNPYGWCTTTHEPDEAVRLFEESLESGNRFDLVTLDFVMPFKNGADLLVEFRALEEKYGITQKNRAVAVMVTSKADHKSLQNCIEAGCNDFIVKPLDKNVLKSKLNKLGFFATGDKELIPSKKSESQKVDLGVQLIKKIKDGDLTLPSPPDLYLEFRNLIQKEASASEIADLLKQDAAVSFKLISVSNSPSYRGVKENVTVEEAIGRLGMGATRKYVALICGRSMYEVHSKRFEKTVNEIWQHSVSCAHLAEILANYLKLDLACDPFTMGVMHDIGKLVLIQLIEILQKNDQLQEDVTQEELDKTITLYQRKFGAYLLKAWGFPKVFSQTALYQPEASQKEKPEKVFLVIAGASDCAFGIKENYEIEKILEFKSVEQLGLSDKDITYLKNELHARLQNGSVELD